jgi:integrase
MDESNGSVPISLGLESELRAYVLECGTVDFDAYLFPSETGTPYDPKNYLNRKLKPLAAAANIEGVNFQALRRTCATHFQNHGGVKDVQALLRHTSPEITLKHYQKGKRPVVTV